MTRIKLFLLAGSITVLVACGGGGGGGTSQPSNTGIPPASAAAPLSVANFGGIAGPSAASILAAAGVSSGLDAVASNTNSTNKLGYSPSNWALWALNAARPGLEQSQASQSGSEACPAGGSLSFTLDDNDNDGDLSRGDRISFTANNCIAVAGELPINGGFSIFVNSISYDANDELIAASLTMSFSNFSSAGNTLNGAVTISVNSSSITTTYTNFSSIRGTRSSAILNYTTVISSNGQLSINGLITINNNTYTLTTVTPITFGLNYPASGVLRVTDAAGGRIDILSSVVSNVPTVICDLYLPGDNTRDGQIISAWSAL